MREQFKLVKSMNSNTVKFSIVIPSRNEEKYISNCIEAILKQNYDLNLIEIIIVDGASTDKTKEIIRNYQKGYTNIKLLENPLKTTPKGLNIGISNSIGDVIVILGAHTEIDPDFIRLNNKYLNEKNVKVTGGTQINVGHTFIQKLIGLAMGLPFGIASASYRWSKKQKFVDTVVYAAYKKELFNEIGYFEENFSISEDAEINWRIRQKGYEIFYSPDIKSYYYPRDSIIKFIIQMFRYGILRVNVVKKHRDALKFIHIIPPFFSSASLFLLLLGLFDHFYLEILFSLILVHFLLSIISSLPRTFPDKLIELLIIPIIILLMHFFWGLGFIIGLILPRSKKW